MALFFTAIAFFVCVVSPVHGTAFLKAKSVSVTNTVSGYELTKDLLEEIESALGTSATKQRLLTLETMLQPMFKALPKNEQGFLDHPTVRYALHRVFVQKHGWYIKGLEPAGGLWNASSPTDILKEQASSYVQDLFERRLQGRGLGLEELAILAATLEHMIHDESVERLDKAYVATAHAHSENLTAEEAGHVLDSYMKLYILGEYQASVVSDSHLKDLYPGWVDTQHFVRGVLASMADAKSLLFNFNTITKTAEEIGERYGRFQDGECQHMKNKLISLGDQGVGRVPLSEFYKPALEQTGFHFTERADYLRELGALDESNPSLPSVIVPNYVSAQSNCIASSSYYSVCCIDECEVLMSHLEKELETPQATPKEIISLVSNLSSSTMDSPRTISKQLINRLDEISDRHFGTVPLHGRLFAQWMHHAYPRECPFPHLAGTTSPRSPDEWLSETGLRTTGASQTEMQRHIDFGNVSAAPSVELRWSAEEQLVVPTKGPVQKSAFSSTMRVGMLVIALIAVFLKTIGMSSEAVSAFTGPNLKKECFVLKTEKLV